MEGVWYHKEQPVVSCMILDFDVTVCKFGFLLFDTVQDLVIVKTLFTTLNENFEVIFDEVEQFI